MNNPDLFDIIKTWAKESELPLSIKVEGAIQVIHCCVNGREIRTAVIYETEIEFCYNNQNCNDLGIKWTGEDSRMGLISERIHASDPKIFEKLERLVRSDMANGRRD